MMKRWSGIKAVMSMRKPRIYLDTSVISHLDAPDTPDKQADTHKLWELIKAGEYDVYISPVVMIELDVCAEPFVKKYIKGTTKLPLDQELLLLCLYILFPPASAFTDISPNVLSKPINISALFSKNFLEPSE